AKQDEANLTVEFDLDRNIDVALQEIQTKIAQAQRRLPEDIDPPIVIKTNPEDQPILWIGLSAQNKPLRQIIEFARDHLKDQIQTVPGVGEVVLSGYVEPNLRVWINPIKLQEHELTVRDVLDAIGREHVEVPAGRIENSLKEFNVRTMGEEMTPEAFGEILITKRGGAPIYKPIRIKEVATIEKGLAEIRRISRTASGNAIGLGIKKQRGSKAVEVASQVKKRLEEVRSRLPQGYVTQVNFDSTRFIEENTAELEFNLILAAILTAVVCLLFLASWGATFNILLAIPVSIIGSFIFLKASHFTLNTFTLLGLTLAIGIVVDDAIMILENIMRHREMGKSNFRAAIDGSTEITPAAIAATIAIIAIFIPVVFMKGVIGKFFLQFGVTLSIAVAISLVEALTLTPMRAARLIRGDVHQEGFFTRLVNKIFSGLSFIYKKILHFCLNLRWLVLIISFGLFAGSLFLFPKLKKEFVPAQDQGMYLIRLQAPLGSSIHYMDEKMKLAESMTGKQPEVLRYFSAVGGFGGGDVNTGIIFVTLKDRKDRPKNDKSGKIVTQADSMISLRKQLQEIPDLKVVIQDLSTRGFTAQRGFPIEFSVRGPDWAQLTESSLKLMDEMKKNPYFLDVDTDYQFGQPEIQITPRREAAALRGVSVQEIGTTINALIGGVRNGKFTENGRRNDVRVRLTDSYRQAASDIEKLFVRNQQGQLVPLSELVDVKEQSTLKSITRKDRERAISIFSNISPGKSQELAIQEMDKISKNVL
ncbi:MAG: efflux RND transporter permease subunit, partial [Deltaproteobacteria bacterium]|nr:efflux RND transporter permease subunit [Deltaproteobacteria bacterium]